MSTQRIKIHLSSNILEPGAPVQRAAELYYAGKHFADVYEENSRIIFGLNPTGGADFLAIPYEDLLISLKQAKDALD